MKSSPTRPTLTGLALATLSLWLVACTTHAAPSHPPATTSPPAAAAPVTTPVTTTPTPTPSHSPTSAPVRAAGPAHCTSAQLRFTAAGSEAAAGTFYEAFRVTNVGPASCWTRGYVRLQMLDASGRKLPTTTRGGVLNEEPRRVTLTKGRWGWFVIGSHRDPSICATALPPATQLAIIAPDTSQAQIITWGLSCDQLQLSPILPASKWQPMAST
jgi:hypothetical protein